MIHLTKCLTKKQTIVCIAVMRHNRHWFHLTVLFHAKIRKYFVQTKSVA